MPRREWLDMKLLLVSSTSKRPEMLHSLKEDKKEYKRVTLDSQILLFLWIGGLKNGEFPVKKTIYDDGHRMIPPRTWSHMSKFPTTTWFLGVLNIS